MYTYFPFGTIVICRSSDFNEKLSLAIFVAYDETHPDLCITRKLTLDTFENNGITGEPEYNCSLKIPYSDIMWHYLNQLSPEEQYAYLMEIKNVKDVKDTMDINDTANDKAYTVFWKDGKSEVIVGPSIEQAFSRSGYGNGAVSAIDFYSEGDTRKEYVWNEEAKFWES